MLVPHKLWNIFDGNGIVTILLYVHVSKAWTHHLSGGSSIHVSNTYVAIGNVRLDNSSSLNLTLYRVIFPYFNQSDHRASCESQMTPCIGLKTPSIWYEECKIVKIFYVLEMVFHDPNHLESISRYMSIDTTSLIFKRIRECVINFYKL